MLIITRARGRCLEAWMSHTSAIRPGQLFQARWRSKAGYRLAFPTKAWRSLHNDSGDIVYNRLPGRCTMPEGHYSSHENCSPLMQRRACTLTGYLLEMDRHTGSFRAPTHLVVSLDSLNSHHLQGNLLGTRHVQHHREERMDVLLLPVGGIHSVACSSYQFGRLSEHCHLREGRSPQ